MSCGSAEIRNQGSWTKEIKYCSRNNRSTIEFQLVKTIFRSYVGSTVHRLTTIYYRFAIDKSLVPLTFLCL